QQAPSSALESVPGNAVVLEEIAERLNVFANNENDEATRLRSAVEDIKSQLDRFADTTRSLETALKETAARVVVPTPKTNGPLPSALLGKVLPSDKSIGQSVSSPFGNSGIPVEDDLWLSASDMANNEAAHPESADVVVHSLFPKTTPPPVEESQSTIDFTASPSSLPEEPAPEPPTPEAEEEVVSVEPALEPSPEPAVVVEPAAEPENIAFPAPSAEEPTPEPPPPEAEEEVVSVEPALEPSPESAVVVEPAPEPENIAFPAPSAEEPAPEPPTPEVEEEAVDAAIVSAAPEEEAPKPVQTDLLKELGLKPFTQRDGPAQTDLLGVLGLPPDKPARQNKPSGQKETVLIANILIGFGNKPYVRGTAPGLSEEAGVAMERIEAGRWRWIASGKIEEPFYVTLWKNDTLKAISDPVKIIIGHTVEIDPVFPAE
ncbi:MAG: hypothetical protein LBV54_08420, partial [Puniceicoccales bacterium]|nr:hypothetical protein [Puniceicoccales bacterium]